MRKWTLDLRPMLQDYYLFDYPVTEIKFKEGWPKAGTLVHLLMLFAKHIDGIAHYNEMIRQLDSHPMVYKIKSFDDHDRILLEVSFYGWPKELTSREKITMKEKQRVYNWESLPMKIYGDESVTSWHNAIIDNSIAEDPDYDISRPTVLEIFAILSIKQSTSSLTPLETACWLIVLGTTDEDVRAQIDPTIEAMGLKFADGADYLGYLTKNISFDRSVEYPPPEWHGKEKDKPWDDEVWETLQTTNYDLPF